MDGSKKTEFFKIANSQNLFVKILDIDPWISRIDAKGIDVAVTYISLTSWNNQRRALGYVLRCRPKAN